MGICWPTSLGSGGPAETALPKKLLGDYGVKCHGTEKQKSDIWLDDLTGDVVREGVRWSIVVDQIQRGEMPPDDAMMQPTALIRPVAAVLSHRLSYCSRAICF